MINITRHTLPLWLGRVTPPLTAPSPQASRRSSHEKRLLFPHLFLLCNGWNNGKKCMQSACIVLDTLKHVNEMIWWVLAKILTRGSGKLVKVTAEIRLQKSERTSPTPPVAKVFGFSLKSATVHSCGVSVRSSATLQLFARGLSSKEQYKMES